MKKKIHPKYHSNATITCSCGAIFKTGSTQEKMEIEICSQCHPFYTGKKKMVDSTGRVDRFKKLSEKSAVRKEAAKKVKKDRKVKVSKPVIEKKIGKKKISKIKKEK